MQKRRNSPLAEIQTEPIANHPPNDRRASLLSFFFPLALYTLSLAPSVTLEDSGELLTAAANLGIPHPPGYPLWCLLAHPFTWIPVGNIAQRVHFFSALAGAATCFMVQAIGWRISGHAWLALFGALMLAVSPSLWSQSVIAEVYSLNALLFAICLWAAVRFVDEPKPRYLHLLGGSLGFAAANHYLTPFLSVPLILWVLIKQPRASFRLAGWLPAILWFMLGLGTYTYLPVRAAADPIPNVGHPRTWQETVDHVLRRAYSQGSETVRSAESWQESAQHAYHAMMGYLPAGFPVLLILGSIAAITFIAKRFDWFLVGTAIVLLNNVALPFIVNDRFNAGWMFVHRIYGIPADVVLACFIASVRPAAALARSTPSLQWLATAGATAAIVAFATISFPAGYRRNDHTAEQVGRAFLDSLPPNAGILPWDDFAYTLLYLTQIERHRPDVVLLAEDLGYDPKKSFSSIYSMVPQSPSAQKDLNMGRIRFVPEGLAYRVERINVATPPIDPKEFKELDPPPTVPPPAALQHDTFHRFARGMVSNYFAEVGNKRWAEGKKDQAQVAWDQAESAADTALSCLRLVDLYEANQIRPEKQTQLLRQALLLHDTYYDPAASRYLYVDRNDITKRLSQREAGSP